jgi:hypothetical protein
VSAVLAAVSDPRPQRATEDPWSRLDAEFLTTAGWNPETETLDHNQITRCWGFGVAVFRDAEPKRGLRTGCA